MRRCAAVFMLCSLLVLAHGAAAAQQSDADAIRETSYRVAGERVLQHELVLDVPIERLWPLWTTAEGLRQWAAPVVEFELKTGGKFHTNYRPEAKIGEPGTIYNTVVSYLPHRMIAYRIGLVEFFPEGPRRDGTLFSVVEFAPAGEGKTRITLSLAGFGAGQEWDKVYEFFQKNNPVALNGLQKALQ